MNISLNSFIIETASRNLLKESVFLSGNATDWPTIIVSLLGVICTAATIIVGIWQFKKESYAKRVTEERTKWLNTMRTLYGTIIAAWKMKEASKNNFYEPNFQTDYYNEKMFEAEKAKAEFITRLNTSSLKTNEYNFKIKEIVMKLDFIKGIDEKDFPKLNQEVMEMNYYVNKMLEYEWKRCKEEVR